MTEEQSGRAVIEYLDGFKAEIHQDLKGLRANMTENADRSLQAHESTRRHVARLATMVKKMWTKVYGSDPPPPAGDDEDLSFSMTEPTTKPGAKTNASLQTAAVKLERHVSEHDATLDGMSGRLITLSSNQNQLAEQVKLLIGLQKEQMGRRDEDERPLLQRLFDGLGWIARERDGRRFALTLIAAVSGLVTAFGTSYAIMTGRLPSPTSPVPAPFVVEAGDRVLKVPHAPGSLSARPGADPAAVPEATAASGGGPRLAP